MCGINVVGGGGRETEREREREREREIERETTRTINNKANGRRRTEGMGVADRLQRSLCLLRQLHRDCKNLCVVINENADDLLQLAGQITHEDHVLVIDLGPHQRRAEDDGEVSRLHLVRCDVLLDSGKRKQKMAVMVTRLLNYQYV